MNATTQEQLVLVLGGNGKTGRRVVQRLKSRSVPIRIGSRSGTPAFDWSERSTWDAALDGVMAIYISYHPDLAVPEAPEAIEELMKKVTSHGIRKVVLLSGRGEEEAQRCEEIVKQTEVDWTILRCSWFNQNFSENFIRDMVLNGVVSLPVDSVKEPFIDAEDIADVAVAALTEDKHDGQLYELTGKELLTFSEVVTQIASATGREIRFQSISREDFITGLTEQGLPQDLISLLDYLTTTVLDGRNSYVCDGVERALGREPRRFQQYAIEADAAGYWAA